ncbi:hypothetical protein EV194_10570 [Natronoflexus pectinivorans]|uniref:Uncharacterized protein n=1 Tax=Natronoflexus pectinivorans TaxID=682526 RepID=A0A4R2GID5_9BACT|nr:hypothetical protein EV194_10570 [Natronoflexus pectinivorans]
MKTSTKEYFDRVFKRKWSDLKKARELYASGLFSFYAKTTFTGVVF